MELQLAGPSTATSVPSKPNKATARSVPAFLNKLYSMVSDTATDDLIYWSDEGDSFFITSADRVAKELLPRFFKHSNFGSFVRQLNMYGFHKVPHLQQGVLKKEKAEEAELLEFNNPNFTRSQPDLLCLIRRQKAKTGAEGTAENGALDFPALLTDLAAIRKHQTAISADLKDLQERNHALWQEALSSREKHKKQEETINKILRFLAGVFGGQVVDQGSSNGGASASPVMPSTSPGPSNPTNAAGKRSTSGKEVVVMPKGRPRLLLEDVKGRQAERAAALRELDGDDDEIEEIPLLQDDDDDLPTISSSLVSSAPSASTSALSRAPLASSSALTFSAASPSLSTSPANRFSNIPTPSPTASPLTGFDTSQLGNLSQDTINVLLQAAGNNPEALTAFLNQHQHQQSNGSSSSTNALTTALSAPSPALPGYSFPSTSLIPTSHNFPQYNPPPSSDLTSLLPTSSVPSGFGALSPSLFAEYAQNNAAISSLNDESLDIHQRTAALESQITSLMNSLPEDAREQVENGTPGQGVGTDALAGFDWGTVTNDDGQFDLDKMMAQFTDSGSNGVSTPSQFNPSLPNADSGIDFSTFLNDASTLPSSTSAPLDPALAALSAPYTDFSAFQLPSLPSTSSTSNAFPPATAAYEVTSPAGSTSLDGMGSPASTAGSVATGEDVQKKVGGGGKKRKSDVLGGSPAEVTGPTGPVGSASEGGTRRSARKRQA
ncbi:hypothetical protein JCM11641_007646 [Rhodosporidiobolus odoratus]